jgi:hypothetical protein
LGRQPIAGLTMERLRGAGLSPAFLVFAGATLLALVVTYPVIVQFGDTIYGTPGDATGGVTQFWWSGYALTHGKSVFDNMLEGVPLGSEWAQVPFVVLPLIVFTPLSALIGPIASYNLLILSGFPLTAWATYLLVRRLGFSALASAFAGLAMAFAPYHVEKAQGHGNETHLEFVALALFFLVRWRQEGRKRDAALAGVMLGLQMWMDYYFTFILAVGLLVFFTVSVFIPPEGLSWPKWLRSNVLASAVMSLVATLFAPLTLLAFQRPGTGSLSSELTVVHRDINELQVYSARPWEYFEPWHANPLVPRFITDWENLHLHGSNWTESTLFLGYTVMALALIGLAINRQRFIVAFSIALGIVGVALAAPPTIHLLGITVHGPSFYVYQVVAFFRVYARFSILVMLGAVILAAAGFSALQVRLVSGRRPLLLLIPFLLLAVEFNNQPPNHVTAILPAPAEYTWLAAQPNGVLMEYPAASGSPQTLEVEVRQYELYQMVHLHPTFLNEDSSLGAVAKAAAQLEPYYGPGVATHLKAYGVRYVFVHRHDYEVAGWSLPTTVDGLTYVTTLDGTDIYTVN